MPDLYLTSPANPRLRAVAHLRRRRVRDAEGVTLVDGFDELALAVDAGVPVHALYWCADLVEGYPARRELVDRLRAAGTPVARLSRAAFEKVAYRDGPDGILAVVAGVPRPHGDLVLPASALVVLCERVEKPGNLGAILRTADAAGVDAVVAADPVTDWGNPNVVRASKGTVFAVPVASMAVGAALDWLRAAGVALVATTPDADTVYTDVDYTGPVALAVGAEQTGLSAPLLEAATHTVLIPMAGRANSLNVATSAALVVYEAVRQRRARLPVGR